ncbi:MAG: hypothetical protein HC814_04710 [Rhodobacteraceae bacterium]|nr:hypothetical protein [Paracoccaceae bacterium]
MPLTFDDLPETDVALLMRLVPLNDGLRGVACTLARLGVGFRRTFPERAARWIEILEPHPFYKLGQVMFDLLEWEDFMLDGEVALAEPQAVADLVNKIVAQAGIEVEPVAFPSDLPPLEMGFYLYRDVVLGGVRLVLEAGSTA